MRSTPLCVFVCPATEELLVRKVTMWTKTLLSHFIRQRGMCFVEAESGGGERRGWGEVDRWRMEEMTESSRRTWQKWIKKEHKTVMAENVETKKVEKQCVVTVEVAQ